jgi:hypothetical protein
LHPGKLRKPGSGFKVHSPRLFEFAQLLPQKKKNPCPLAPKANGKHGFFAAGESG